MRLSTYGGIAEPVGPPGFGRLNDITAYHSGYGPSGLQNLYLKGDQEMPQSHTKDQPRHREEEKK